MMSTFPPGATMKYSMPQGEHEAIPSEEFARVYGFGYMFAYTGLPKFSEERARAQFPNWRPEVVHIVHTEGVREGVQDKSNGFPQPESLSDFMQKPIEIVG